MRALGLEVEEQTDIFIYLPEKCQVLRRDQRKMSMSREPEISCRSRAFAPYEWPPRRSSDQIITFRFDWRTVADARVL